MDRSARANWERLAQRWRIVEPLAPGAEDQAWFERQATGRTGARVLLLGVTGRIAAMRWPASTTLVAADWSPGMMRHLPPGLALPLCADWRELPVRESSFDLAIGDGCYSALAGLDDMAVFNAELARILRAGGTVLMRCFCRPARPIDLGALFQDLRQGRFRNLDLFRWLLAMAVHGASKRGVVLGDAWEAWARHVPDARALRARMGWTEDGLENLERWAGSAFRYSFPTLEELRGLAAPAFDVVACDTPGYEWGELFPRLVLRAR
jgi:SAM-dependent methyltransferase